jgi:hypothetical protein
MITRDYVEHVLADAQALATLKAAAEQIRTSSGGLAAVKDALSAIEQASSYHINRLAALYTTNQAEWT